MVIRKPVRKQGFTLLELTLVCSLFILISVVLVATLNQVTALWRRSNSRDDAVRQLLKAKTSLVRDLVNGSQVVGQFNTAQVPAHRTGFDGDALTFLSSDDGTSSANWATQSTGQAALQAEITYYLVIPNAPNSYGLACASGPADSAGYEQQCPFKWLMRRVDASAGALLINPAWQTWLVQPSSLASTSTIQVVADQMFQFRVLQAAPNWNIQISAVAVADATRQVSVGNVPLAQSKFNMVEQFYVPTSN